MKYYLNSRCIILTILCISVRGSAQTDFQREVGKQIANDADGKFLYEHSDAYRNRIEWRARQKFSVKESDEILGGGRGKDIYYDANDQNETTIAINRKDPNLIIAGSNDGAEASLQMPVYITKDGGQSWHTSRLPVLPVDRMAGGDPMIAASDDGRFYYAFLTTPWKYASLPIQLVVAVSTDGENWTDMQPVGVQNAVRSLQDKPTIVADNSPLSPNHGRVYVSWTVSTDDKPSSGLRVAYSDDYGKSWNNKKVLTTGANDLFAQLSIGKNGEVLISYSNLDDSSHHLLVSKDGALTFENRLISNFIPFPINTVGRPSLKGIYGFRAYPYPATRVDLSTNRLHAVYGSWKVWSSVDSSAELLYTFSDDLGQTWKSPIIVGESENISLIHRDHFFPWLAFDEYTHQTSLVYYSSEDDISNIKTTPYRLTIAGNGLSSASLIGDSMFNPLYESSPSHGVPAFIGDYIGCDVYKNRFASAWTQNRPNQNDGDVFAFIGTTDTLVSKVDDLRMKVNSDRLWLSNVFPNPTKERYAVVNFTIPVSGNVGLDIFSMSGVLIKNIFKRNILAGSYSQEIDLRSIASGYYEVRLSTQLNILERQLIISH